MSNEELATLIQAGERDRLPELWAQVERFVWRQGRRWLLALDGRGGVALEDLLQCGFLALVDAVDSYRADKGKNFIGWFDYRLKTAFSEAYGLRTQLQRQDPIHQALRLEAPLTDKVGDPLVLADVLQDPAAEAAFDSVEKMELRETMRKALQSLTEDQRTAVYLRYWCDLTLEQIGNSLGLSRSEVALLEQTALRKLRHPVNSQKLMQYR